METHDDSSHRAEFLSRLTARADRMREEKASEITAGSEGEVPLKQWEYGGVHCREMPADPQGILRISIGGGETAVQLDYCVHRGDKAQCIALLRRALRALES